MKRIVALLASLFLYSVGYAQAAGTVSITATPTAGNGVINTSVNWTSTPPATSCALTGGGITNPTAAASGTVTDTITKTTIYSVACNWTRTSNIVHWVAPTTNTDGSPLTDLAGFTVWFAPQGSSVSQSQKFGPTVTSATITPSAPGTYNYAITAQNSAGLSSANSPSVTGPAIGTTSATATATTTVTPIPSTPTGVTVQ